MSPIFPKEKSVFKRNSVNHNLKHLSSSHFSRTFIETWPTECETILDIKTKEICATLDNHSWPHEKRFPKQKKKCKKNKICKCENWGQNGRIKSLALWGLDYVGSAFNIVLNKFTWYELCIRTDVNDTLSALNSHQENEWALLVLFFRQRPFTGKTGGAAVGRR